MSNIEDEVPAWRRGLVTEVDAATARVRVQLPDADGVVTDWLPVVAPVALGARFYGLPRVGSQVVVLLDEHLEDGVVVGAIYSKADPAPISAPRTLYLELEDGTKITLDPEASLVRVETPGQLQAQAGGNVTVQAGGNATVNADGDATVQAGGKATVQAASEIDLTAPVVKVSGILQVAGAIQANGGITTTSGGAIPGGLTMAGTVTAPEASVNGIAVSTHKHGGVGTGLGVTQGPQ